MLRILTVLALVMATSQAIAGAWTLERGKSNVFVTSTFTYGDHGFDDDGDLVSVPEYQKFTLNGAFEYGVRPWLTAVVRGELRQEQGYGPIGQLPYEDPRFVPGRDDTRTIYGQTDVSYAAIAAGARARLLEGDYFVVSTEGLLSSGGFDENITNAPSDGPFAEIRGLFGVGGPVLGLHSFFDAQAGYRARFEEDDADEIVIDLTVGVHVHPRWLILAQTFSTFELGRNTDYTKAGASVVYEVTDKLSLEVGGLATVAGRNALQEIGGKVGFWRSF
ncbi:MAG: hypothetical protein AAGJ94_07410 [Pseudomonadota bacterium]